MRSQGESPELGERSPLISSAANSEDGDVESHSLSGSFGLADSIIENKSTLYLFLLTLSIGGLQIVWSVELSNGSPFLLSLGMSKAFLAFVWLAGPLTGALVQPYVGIMSDNCRSRFGKRKPFMVFGGLATMFALMWLSWSREIVSGIFHLFSETPSEIAIKNITIAQATALMWVLDFAINTVQAGIRAFIVDNAPSHQQESANAWASRITGIGSILGYVFGYIDLPRYMPFFGNTQFKVLCVVANIALSSTLAISCSYIKERDPREEGPPKSDNPGILDFFRQVFKSIKRLPPNIRKVCEIQFFYWIGWFPFLFYITTYIGQLYVNPDLKPGLTDAEVDALWAKATRIGTLALLVYAIVSSTGNIFLPFIVVPTYKPQPPDDPSAILRPNSPVGIRHRRSSFGEVSHAEESGLSVFLPTESRDYTLQHERPNAISRALLRLQVPGLTLRRMWFFSQLLFVICMFSTFFIHTPLAATIMTAFVGISWALASWAPFALISAEVARRDEATRKKRRQQHSLDEQAKDEEETDQAGIILGLHNVAISSPQILASLASSVIFHFLQTPRGVSGDSSVGWTLRLGGLAAVVAAFITYQLGEPGDES
jgi:solute carrier family 45 protein 1/2/4